MTNEQIALEIIKTMADNKFIKPQNVERPGDSAEVLVQLYKSILAQLGTLPEPQA